VIVLDASVWVSALQSGDANHTLSDQWLARWLGDGQTIIVPNIFLAEVSGAITRRTGDSDLGHQIIADLIDDPSVQLIAIDSMLAERAAQLAVRMRLRGADAIYVALAAHRNVPLMTWDREQLSRASDLITVQSPTM
jgi:predicted nucleic acid-binding protein